ncbi:MAG: CAP domain-containing protein [Myxococcales bacterium]|nr:MAG: CAP domain-containing protein [Myxococcales bacterium]
MPAGLARRLRFLLLVLALGSGCAPRTSVAPTPSDQPPASPPEAEDKKNESAEAVAPYAFHTAPNPTYFQPLPEWAGERETGRSYLTVLRDAWPASPPGFPAPDGALAQAAAELARYVAMRQGAPPDGLVARALWRAGSGDVNPELAYFGQPRNGPTDELKAFLTRWAQKALERRPIDRLGLGVYTHAAPNGEVDYLVALGVERSIEVDPLDKNLPDDGRFRLSGRVRQSNPSLRAYLDYPGGHILDAPLSVADGRFDLPIQTPTVPAVFTLEIVAETGKGRRVLVSAPLYYRRAEPDGFSYESDEADCMAPETGEARLHETINGLRLEDKNSPLSVSEALVGSARAHAADMLVHNYSSILDREGRDPMARLADSSPSLQPLQAGEIVEGGYDFAAIRDKLRQSPSLQNFVKDANLTHIGCGIATRPHGEGCYFSVSCLVATRLDPRSEEDLRQAIFDRINRLRRKAGREPFAAAPLLNEVSDRTIARMVDRPDAVSDIHEETLIEVERLGVVKESSRFGVFTLYDLSQLATNSAARPLVEADLDYLALGVRKADDPRNPRRGIFVYFIAYR